MNYDYLKELLKSDFSKEEILKLIEIFEESNKYFNYTYNPIPYVETDTYSNQTNSYCEYCSNHPKNGGSGICHCILGTPIIY